MTELPEDVARELEELYGGQDVPTDAVTVKQLAEQLGGSTTMWAKRLDRLITEGKWMRSRKTGGQAYYYWSVEDE